MSFSRKTFHVCFLPCFPLIVDSPVYLGAKAIPIWRRRKAASSADLLDRESGASPSKEPTGSILPRTYP